MNNALNDTDIFLAVVGLNWRGVAEDGSIRINEANDLVRIEVETALKRDIPVIPVVIDGAVMPKPTELPESLAEFSFRNAASIDGGRNFDNDIERLISSMDGLIEGQQKIRAEQLATTRQEHADEKGKRLEEGGLRKDTEREEQKRRREQEERERQERERELQAKSKSDERSRVEQQSSWRRLSVWVAGALCAITVCGLVLSLTIIRPDTLSHHPILHNEKRPSIGAPVEIQTQNILINLAPSMPERT